MSSPPERRRVAVLAGRRIDPPDRADPRFPPSAIPAVRSALEALFKRERIDLLICSAANGADLIALDVAIRLNIGVKIILPCDPATFRAESVTDRPGDWGRLFDSAVRSADRAGALVDMGQSPDDSDKYERVTERLFAEAQKETSPGGATAIVVWDGVSRGARDYTAQFAAIAAMRHMPTVTILPWHDPAAARAHEPE